MALRTALLFRPPLPTKPIKFSAASFNNKQASVNFNVRLKCLPSSAESHHTCYSPSFSSSPPLGRVGETRGVLWDSSPSKGEFAAVGLLGTAKTLQIILNYQIAAEVCPYSLDPLKYFSNILTAAKEALLLHSDYWISSHSSVTPSQNVEDAAKCFNKLSDEERAKFNEETLVNVNNRKNKIPITSKNDNKMQQNECIVVTVLVATEGEHTLPTVNSSAELKNALQNLGSITSKTIIATEVLWTPQQENDVLTEEELLKDYPLLKRFSVRPYD